MKRSALLLIGVFFVFSLFAACSKKSEKGLPDKVVLQLKWQHQAQFAGFYLAREAGYYAQENLDVQFIEGGQGVDLVQYYAEPGNSCGPSARFE